VNDEPLFILELFVVICGDDCLNRVLDFGTRLVMMIFVFVHN
jgi:hypothetical protein